ncbi:hypothetical protein QBC38DRAFT_117969 [Podospora fimiseda]|uniref:Transmembrane protein n=1 Tax=Podospora fimiseda TaxID=252190 RepID=A0AAN6YND4_9PEZI|nr:hypothetical protein QBC38DRAFT_117969 [Podospora fimiseda]
MPNKSTSTRIISTGLSIRRSWGRRFFVLSFSFFPFVLHSIVGLFLFLFWVLVWVRLILCVLRYIFVLSLLLHGTVAFGVANRIFYIRFQQKHSMGWEVFGRFGLCKCFLLGV